MKLLLDTHIVLWWLDDDPKLPKAALDAIRTERHQVFISAASAWEMSVKRALGKLRGPSDLESVLELRDVLPLDVSIPHAVAAGTLPRHHADPFDRMLVAQAQIEELTLVTVDPVFSRYDVRALEL